MLNGKHIDAAGTEKWFKDDKLHRLGGPATTFTNGTMKWFVDGGLHRTDGPAVIWNNGDQWWYLNSKQYNFDEFVRCVLIPRIDKTSLVLKYA